MSVTSRARRSAPPGEPRSIGWLYAAPALLVYGAFLLYPLIRAAQISLYDWDGLSVGTWAGLDNYKQVAQDEGLRAAFGHALVLMVFFAVVPLALGLALAAVLNRAKVRGLGFFRTVVFLPQVIAMVVVAVAWRRIYAPDGSLNDLLSAVGLGDLGRAWLGDYALALPAVGLIGTWFETGLVTVLMLAGMGRVDRQLYEAARLDGAGPVREFFAITLPAVRGEISVADAHGDRRAEDLRPGLRHHQGWTRQRDQRAVVRGLPPGVRGRRGRPGVRDRRRAHGADLRDLVRHHPPGRPGRRMRAGRGEQVANYVVLVVFAVFAIYPIVTIVVAALGHDAGAPGGLANFREAWDVGHFGSYMRTSVIVSLIVVSVAPLNRMVPRA